ncbi:hypothetical protein DFP72DRAFT_1074783 [Ephemerocybe angulata]|uniref:Uncharacterized protein n=1 Tax=Ephemerocybe angulata TaxID=980116 RepID=A0A8H6HKL9_9AGAR|nr:hypothetical protein DFP72DRAFT_1074783 [Tulosesus angulatus]
MTYSNLAIYDHTFLESLNAVFEPENIFQKRAIIVEQRPKNWYFYEEEDIPVEIEEDYREEISSTPAPPPSPQATPHVATALASPSDRVKLPAPMRNHVSPGLVPRTLKIADYAIGPVETPEANALLHSLVTLWWRETVLFSLSRHLPFLAGLSITGISPEAVMSLMISVGGEVLVGRGIYTWIIMSYLLADIVTFSFFNSTVIFGAFKRDSESGASFERIVTIKK